MRSPWSSHSLSVGGVPRGYLRVQAAWAGGGLLELSRSAGPVTEDKLSFWLQVRDVDAEFARLEAAGVTVAEAPVDEPWGLREARVRDPDGLMLVLVEIRPTTRCAGAATRASFKTLFRDTANDRGRRLPSGAGGGTLPQCSRSAWWPIRCRPTTSAV